MSEHAVVPVILRGEKLTVATCTDEGNTWYNDLLQIRNTKYQWTVLENQSRNAA